MNEPEDIDNDFEITTSGHIAKLPALGIDQDVVPVTGLSKRPSMILTGHDRLDCLEDCVHTR